MALTFVSVDCMAVDLQLLLSQPRGRVSPFLGSRMETLPLHHGWPHDPPMDHPFFRLQPYESPKYLMGHGRESEAIEFLEKVATYNGSTNHLTLEQLWRTGVIAGAEAEGWHCGWIRRCRHQEEIERRTRQTITCYQEAGVVDISADHFVGLHWIGFPPLQLFCYILLANSWCRLR